MLDCFVITYKTHFLFCFIHLHSLPSYNVHCIKKYDTIFSMHILFLVISFQIGIIKHSLELFITGKAICKFCKPLRPVLIHDLWLSHITGTRNLNIISNSWSCNWFYVCSLKMIKNFVIKGTKSKHSSVLVINVDSTNVLFFDWIEKSPPSFPRSFSLFLSLSYIENLFSILSLYLIYIYI